MTTTTPMFTSKTAATAWHQPLPQHYTVLAGDAGWNAAFAAVCDAVEAEFCADADPEDSDAVIQMSKSVNDAVTNTWIEGLSHDEWVSAALRRLRAG